MIDSRSMHPKDEYNTELLSNVCPSDWENPVPEGRYNLVVIGAGTAGLVAAASAAALGAKVALIKCTHMGGDCLNTGCLPSKGMIRAGRASAAVRDTDTFGVRVPDGVTTDFASVMQRMRRMRANISTNDSATRFHELAVDLYLGRERFTDTETVEVEGQTLRFSKALIATGTRPSPPPITGLDQVNHLTNETLFSLTERPATLGVIGAGPIGTEFGQTFAQLGSDVLLIESRHGVLPKEDRHCAEIVQHAMARDGVKVLCCGRQMEVAPGKNGGIRLKLETHGENYDQEVDELLTAAGRAPNQEGLNLKATGVKCTTYGVSVDDRLRTSNKNIFAAGNVCSRYKFTHAADFMGRIVLQNALFMEHAKVSDLAIPWCTYTSPELAHVGLSEKEAEEQGMPVDTYRQKLAEVDRTILDGETEGVVKLHCKKGTDKILGATIVAANAGDMISEITLAMKNNVGLADIGDTIHPYPTQAEAIRKLGDQYKRNKLTPTVNKILNKWLSWRR